MPPSCQQGRCQMPLRCLRCWSLVEVPNQLNRFFNMPVACYMPPNFCRAAAKPAS